MKRTHIRAAAIGTALCTGIVATMAVRAFFNRPGESALRLMPRDMDMVFIQDLVPAPGQVMAFARIEKSLAQSGVTNAPLNLVESELNEDELSKSVGPYLGKSVAAGLKIKNFDWAKSGGGITSPEGIAFVSLTDPSAAAAALKKSLKPAGAGYYKLASDGKFVRVADDYLEIASSPSYFSKVDSIVNGKAKPIISEPRFAAIHDMAERDANFRVYLRNPNAHAWGVVCGSIEDSGVRLVVKGAPKWAIDKAAAAVLRPVDASTLKRLPSGPYLLCAVAQPAAYASGMTKQLGSHRKSGESAFGGDFVLGLYPSQKPWAGIDLLLYLGANNGARPGEAVRDMLKEVQHTLTKGKAIFGKPESIGRALVYTPAGDFKDMIRNGVKGPVPGVRSDVLLKGKTLAYATMGQALYVSTSKELLKRAIAAGEGRGLSIQGDSDYKPFCKAQTSGSQFMLAIDFARVCAGITNTALPGNTDAGKAARDIGIATHGNAIFNISGGTARDASVHGRLFVPINYARAAKVFAESQN